MDLRQSPQWKDYLLKIGWIVESVDGCNIFIRKVPLLNLSLFKIQRPPRPIPFDKIDHLAKKNRALFVLIEPDYKQHEPAQFIQNHYRLAHMNMAYTATIVLDTSQTMEKLWFSFSENARRNIKKGQRNNLTIKVIKLNDMPDNRDFEIFLDLLKNLSRIRKFYIPSDNEQHKKLVAFKKTSYLLFCYQKHSSLPIAALWMDFNKDKAFYLNTGITEQGYKLMANYLLVWEALKLSKKLGKKIFDFEGIYDPRYPKDRKKWQNFTEFKKRFHGQIIEYPPSWIKFYNPIFKIFYLCANKFLN